jgi:hypothetical protein
LALEAGADIGEFAYENKAFLVAGACLTGVGCGIAVAGSFAGDALSFFESIDDPCFELGSGLPQLGVSAISSGSAVGLAKAAQAGLPAAGNPLGMTSEEALALSQVPGVSIDLIGNTIETHRDP